MTSTKRRRGKPRGNRGTGRGRGPLVIRLKKATHAQTVVAHLLAYGPTLPGGLVDYQPLRSACLRSGLTQAEFERELGRLADQGALAIERYRPPGGPLLNQYRLATELRVK